MGSTELLGPFKEYKSFDSSHYDIRNQHP